MALSTSSIEILSIIAVLAGFFSAIAGTSGMIILPALLLAGMPIQIALGTNKLFTTTTLSSSAFYFIRKRFFDPRYWVASIIASAIGAVLGVVLLQLIAIEYLEKMLPIMITLIAFYLILPKRAKEHSKELKEKRRKTVFGTISSLILGIYSGLLGAGTGAMWTAFANSYLKLDGIEACAISRFMCFITNFVALIVFMSFHLLDYKIGIDLAVCGAVGGYFGAKIAVKFGKNVIRFILIIVTFSMAINLSIKSWFGYSFTTLMIHLLYKFF